MSRLLLLATSDGLVTCQSSQAGWQVTNQGMAGTAVTSVIAREGVILAGTRQGVYRSDDLGETWQEASDGITTRHIRWLAYHPDISDFELAGTEPAAIYISRDGAKSWRECREVSEMRDRYGWYLPYSPEAGCVRGFAIAGQRAYAAVEDGCMLVSNDGGETWRLAEGSLGEPDHNPGSSRIHSDVHSVEVDPASPDRVYAPTGGGFFSSEDGGKSWTCLFRRCYCRATWIDPGDAQHILLGTAEGVDRNGRIEESRDGGRSWRPAVTGLEVPWPRHMVERFAQVGDQILAVLSNGELLTASPDSLEWQRILSDVEGVSSVAWLDG